MEVGGRTRIPVLVGVLASSAVVVLLVVGLLVVLRGPSWLPGGADCTVARGDRTVELSTVEAQRAATVAARAVRLRLPVGTAATAIQDLVDLSDQDARVVALALTGRAPHALSCRHGGDEDEESDRLSRRGLTARAEVVRRDLVAAFGRQQLGGFAPGGVTTGHMPGSAHYEGRAVDVFYRPADAPHRRHGWATAQYLVAHADRLAVSTVIYDGRIWTARRSQQGWRTYAPDTGGRSAAVAAVLEHRDHVHVDVAD